MIKKNSIKKAGQITVFSDNIEAELKMECCICNNKFERNYSVGDIDDYRIAKEEFSQEAYSEGWRYSTSSVFNHIGIHCPSDHKNRNNPKKFDY